MLVQDYSHRDPKRELHVEAKFDDKVGLVKSYPGITADLIDALVDKGYHGIVLEGTGLGHVPERLYESVKRAKGQDIVLVMTSQCISGRIDMNVYSTGRELLSMGVVPGEDMTTETALVKLMWLLGRGETPDRVRELIKENIAGEITDISRAGDSTPDAV
jgi:glutamyl-tRNA(Gln) amidotransferase subunit D